MTVPPATGPRTIRIPVHTPRPENKRIEFRNTRPRPAA